MVQFLKLHPKVLLNSAEDLRLCNVFVEFQTESGSANAERFY